MKPDFSRTAVRSLLVAGYFRAQQRAVKSIGGTEEQDSLAAFTQGHARPLQCKKPYLQLR